MSAREWLIAALVEALADIEGVRVFDAPTVRGAVPHVVVGEPVVAGRDAAGLIGVEARVSIEVVDAGERPVRLRLLQARVENVLAAWVPEPAGEGWHVAACSLARSRLVRGGGDRWRAIGEWVVRLYRVG